MNEAQVALTTASVVFTLVALLHLWRYMANFDVTFGNWHAPQWASLVAFVIAGGLAIWMMVEAKREG